MASHFIILVCLALCTTGVMCSRIRRPTRTTTLPTTPPTTPPTAANFNAWAISPPSDQCSHSGYDSTRSPVERVHDATYLYMRQLKKLTYQIPHNNIHFLPKFENSDSTHLHNLRTTLSSLLSLLKEKNSLESLNTSPSLSLAVLNKVVEDACEWIYNKTGLRDPEFNCTNTAQVNTLQNKLDLYLIMSELAPSTAGVRSPLEELYDTTISRDHPHYCGYWSSHVLGNCTGSLTSADAGLVQAHRATEDMLNGFCDCKVCTITGVQDSSPPEDF